MKKVQAKTVILEKISRGEPPIGIFISSKDATVTDIMASVGFDFVQIDCEHATISLQDVENHARAANAGGILPFVRILQNSREIIQSTLDAGAQGLIVPHVDTADDAKKAVASSRYAPRGARGMCPANYAGRYSMSDWPEHMKYADDNVLIMPIIESRLAVENIEEIIAVDGIDIVHFGPGDLSVDMEIDLNIEVDKLMSAWHKVREAVHKAGKYVFTPRGFGFEGGDGTYVEMDLMILQRVGREIVNEHRKLRL